MKRKNIIFLSLVAVVILTLVLIAFFVQIHPIEIRYFTDISSFSALEPYVVGNLDAFQDSDIDKETVAASYAKTIEYSGRKYDVYAYVFEDTASAAAYFRDCTGETVSGERQYKSESVLFLSTTYVAFYKECLFRVEGGWYPSFVEALNAITAQFPITEAALETQSP